jgi:hypothetical protein
VTPPFVFETVIEEGLLFWETEDWWGVKFFVSTERDGPRNSDAATTATTPPTTTARMMTTSIVWLRPGFLTHPAGPGTALTVVNMN